MKWIAAALIVLSGCAKVPGFELVPKPHSVPVNGNCKVSLAETKDYAGTICPVPKVGVGLTSLSPPTIRCVLIDVDC